MEYFGNALEQLKNVDVPVKCRRCGALPLLTGTETSVRCPACGMTIEVSRSRLVFLKQKEKALRDRGEFLRAVRCSICRDTGVVLVEKQVDGVLCEYGYRCLCGAGAKREDLAAWPVLPPGEAKSVIYALEGR